MCEEMIVRHCSPTLAGIKTGNIFNLRYNCQLQFKNDIRRINQKLTSKGLRVIPLKMLDKSALIYVYRPSMLEKDLLNSQAERLLESRGYRCSQPTSCVVRLIKRLRDSEDFPHEIGLFLGYPPEDVQGFIDNSACNCKCTGCWKVYGDEDKARKLFADYKDCTARYLRKYAKGNPLEELAVSA